MVAGFGAQDAVTVPFKTINASRFADYVLTDLPGSLLWFLVL
jgi:hypothetical protein